MWMALLFGPVHALKSLTRVIEDNLFLVEPYPPFPPRDVDLPEFFLFL